MNLPPPNMDFIPLKGGLNQKTPTLSLAPGAARQSLNFECGVDGGYTRIKGYERFDGHSSPTTMSDQGLHRIVSVAAYTNTPVVGNTITASGGATGVLAYISGLVMVLTKVTGTWAAGETIAVGATPIGTLVSVTVSPTSAEQDAIIRGAVADIYRADIAAVPGSGTIRGITALNGVKYAFRDAVAGTTLDIYKSTASGWTQVPLYKTVSFTAGGLVEPASATTLTQGAVTAVIKRVARCSGSWQNGTAAGQFIIATPAGGNFTSGAATIDSINVTLSGAQTALSLLPGGRFEFVRNNFYGQAATTSIYGCDGVNKGFEFDGDVLTPITTGATTDTPTHVVAHRGYLFLSIGSSAIHSAPGDPFDFTALSGAGELATGATINCMATLPGGNESAALAILSGDNTHILYGTDPSTWNLVPYNTGLGAMAYSVQNMSQTFIFNATGAESLQAALQFGNFSQSSLTSNIEYYIEEHATKFTASTLCRAKSQYRAFFSDGFGLITTVVNGKHIGNAPIFFPNPVYCTYEGQSSTGEQEIFFGSANGMVYQMEKGTSFDGTAIDFSFTTNYANAKSPRVLKRYRKATPELMSDRGSFVSFLFGYSLGYGSSEYEQDFGKTYDRYAAVNYDWYDVPSLDEYDATRRTYDYYTGQTNWDSFVWDNFFWDSTGSSPAECELEGTAENIAFVISGSSSYIRSFTVNSILVHYSPRRMMR